MQKVVTYCTPQATACTGANTKTRTMLNTVLKKHFKTKLANEKNIRYTLKTENSTDNRVGLHLNPSPLERIILFCIDKN
jgi:hypothetical protein